MFEAQPTEYHDAFHADSGTFTSFDDDAGNHVCGRIIIIRPHTWDRGYAFGVEVRENYRLISVLELTTRTVYGEKWCYDSKVADPSTASLVKAFGSGDLRGKTAVDAAHTLFRYFYDNVENVFEKFFPEQYAFRQNAGV